MNIIFLQDIIKYVWAYNHQYDQYDFGCMWNWGPIKTAILYNGDDDY